MLMQLNEGMECEVRAQTPIAEFFAAVKSAQKPKKVEKKISHVQTNRPMVFADRSYAVLACA